MSFAELYSLFCKMPRFAGLPVVKIKHSPEVSKSKIPCFCSSHYSMNNIKRRFLPPQMSMKAFLMQIYESYSMTVNVQCPS